MVLRSSVACRTLDNITVVIVCFQNFKDSVARAHEPTLHERDFHPKTDIGIDNDVLIEEVDLKDEGQVIDKALFMKVNSKTPLIQTKETNRSRSLVERKNSR